MPLTPRRTVALACCGLLGLTAAAAAPAMAHNGPRGHHQKAFKKWAKSYGLRGHAARPLADPDRDGRCNWVEYGARTNPAQQDGSTTPAPNAVFKVKGHISAVTEDQAGVISSVTVQLRMRGAPGTATVTITPQSLLVLDAALITNTSPANDGVTVGDEIKAYATRSGDTYSALLALIENDDHPITPPVAPAPAAPAVTTTTGPAAVVVPPGCKPDDSRPNGLECETGSGRHGRG